MRHLKIHPDLVTQAMGLSMKMGILNGAVSSEESNVIGFLGELLHLKLFGGERIDDYQYDILSNKGYRIDVKSIGCTSPPKPHYVAKVLKDFSGQDCHYYSFFRIHKSLEEGWYLGYLSKREFMQKATLLRTGEFLPGTNVVSKADQYQVEIKDLR